MTEIISRYLLIFPLFFNLLLLFYPSFYSFQPFAPYIISISIKAYFLFWNSLVAVYFFILIYYYSCIYIFLYFLKFSLPSFHLFVQICFLILLKDVFYGFLKIITLFDRMIYSFRCDVSSALRNCFLSVFIRLTSCRFACFSSCFDCFSIFFLNFI